jgi:hypothetical protein
MKVATKEGQRNLKLPKNNNHKKSLNQVVNETNDRMGSNLSAKTVSRYIREGLIGVSPLRKGPTGDLEPRIYVALKGAYSTFL